MMSGIQNSKHIFFIRVAEISISKTLIIVTKMAQTKNDISKIYFTIRKWNIQNDQTLYI